MQNVTALPAGLSVAEFVEQCGFSRPFYYKLQPDCLPHSVKLGRRVIITERPGDWLERMRASGGAKIKPQPAKKAA